MAEKKVATVKKAPAHHGTDHKAVDSAAPKKERAEIKKAGPLTKEEKLLVSHFEKVVVTVGVGKAGSNANFEDKYLPQVISDIAAMTGQKPNTTSAKKSIAGFKVREGQVVGVRVTLRGKKMVDFLTRFVRIVLPRVRDFSGVAATKIDQGGTLNVGVKEQYVFPEINPEKSQNSFSLGISAVPKIKVREATIEVLNAIEFPFTK